MRPLLAALALIAGLFAGTPTRTTTSLTRVDLAAWYPGRAMSDGWYLDGWNYTTTPTSWSVLWFDGTLGSFRQYNSAPYGTCHYDQLAWSTSRLGYTQTHDACGTDVRDTVYDPPIVLLPRQWNQQPWTLTGSSTVHTTINGTADCAGVDTWVATIDGWTTIAPGVVGIVWSTTQTTTWTDGRCAGWTTRWRETYDLADIPTPTGGVAHAVKRSVGGNVDVPADTWDVWFDRWAALPPR